MDIRKKNRVKINYKNSGCDRDAARQEKEPGGAYFCDYRPRYQEPYDIYEKAKKHVKKLKKVVDKEKSL